MAPSPPTGPTAPPPEAIPLGFPFRRTNFAGGTDVSFRAELSASWWGMPAVGGQKRGEPCWGASVGPSALQCYPGGPWRPPAPRFPVFPLWVVGFVSWVAAKTALQGGGPPLSGPPQGPARSSLPGGLRPRSEAVGHQRVLLWSSVSVFAALSWGCVSPSRPHLPQSHVLVTMQRPR